MTQASEEIARQFANSSVNKKTWGDILYNVKAYGATGDGITDDTGFIQAAINYALSVGGKAIYFPHGTYKVTSLSNLSSVVLVGDNAQFSGISDLITQFGAAPLSSLYRQALINGNFDVWQRGTSFAMIAANVYAADRWCAFNVITNQASTISRQDGSSVDGSVFCLRYQRNSGQTGTTAMNLAQSLETIDSKKFIGKKITLSFYARVGTGASFSSLTASIKSGTGTDQNVLSSFTGSQNEASQSFTLTTTWQRFTLTTTSTLANTKSQLGAVFVAMPTGTAGANDYFEIAQVQVNAGDQALPFQPRSFTDELALCQRYYEKSYDYTTNPGTASAATGIESRVVPSNTIAVSQPYGKVSYKTQKRVPVTVTIYPFTTPSNTGRVSANAGSDLGANSGTFIYSGYTGFTVYNASGGSLTTTDSAIIFHWAADAEF